MVMVTSPCEWKILYWDEKPQNKQTNKQINKLKQLEISFGMIIKDALGFFHQWDSTSFKKCPNFSLCTFFKNCMIYIIYLHVSCFRVALTFRPFHPPMTLLKQNISYRFVGVCMHVKIGILIRYTLELYEKIGMHFLLTRNQQRQIKQWILLNMHIVITHCIKLKIY